MPSLPRVSWSRREVVWSEALCPIVPVFWKLRFTFRTDATCRGPCGIVCAPGFAFIPGSNVVSTRSRKSKVRYHASRSSKMCESARCVPPSKYPPFASVYPSVSKFAIRVGPRPAFCVEVKPRNSSEVCGTRSAPGTPAASAIRFGRLMPPSNPPPAKPIRTLVGSRKSSASSLLAPSATASLSSLRSRKATSFASRTTSRGSLGKRIEWVSALIVCPLARVARRSTGICAAASSGTKRSK